MSLTTIRIGQKEVFASYPYVPDKDRMPELIGKQDQMELITAAWMGGEYARPMAPVLLGEPGVGKNRIVYELAKNTGKNLYIFQGHEDVTAEDLACAVRFSDSPDRKMDYVISPLVTAMKFGGICFIDEIAKIRPRALALLVSVLDDRQYIDSTLLGERIYAHEGFRFIAATNTTDYEENLMPEFIQSRMKPVITVGYPDQQEMAQILKTQFPKLKALNDEIIHLFWALREKNNSAKPPTPRDAIHIFNLASSISDLEVIRKGTGFLSKMGVHLSKVGHPFAVNKGHLEKAFGSFFSTRTLPRTDYPP